MWWAIFITITLSSHHHKTIIPPGAYGTYGECQEAVDKLLEAPISKRKSTILIRCDEALGSMDEREKDNGEEK